MKVTLSWLKEYVDITLSIQELAHTLTMSGLEVESVEEVARPFSGIVVSRILSCEPHPRADKLQVCQVDAGRGEPQRVVCGAPNARAGMLAPLALPGARLGELTVELREIRGLLSSGMLCSEVELGLTERGEGVMVLDECAKPGQDLNEWLGGTDYVIDIFITPNRPDCLSVIGLAREIAAATRVPLHIPAASIKTSAAGEAHGISVAIATPDLCPRYSGRALENIRIAPSPFWMAYRLHHAGMRAINNIVDITNYSMLENGHPLHAFDASRIEGRRILVRRAQAGERFTTLDGKEHQLEADTCLICDGARPVALAGIMGGLNSEVEAETRTLFLESAYFEPTGIRKSSKRLGISTESSKRFERGADPNGTLYALDRAASLIMELAGARPAGEAVDVYPAPIAPALIDLSLDHVNRLIGTELTATEAERILTSLEIACGHTSTGSISCKVPTFRPDLTRPVDLIEEIARVYGFDRIPFARTVILDQSQTPNPRTAFQDEVRRLLSGYGLRETLSLSLVSPQAAAPFLGEGCSLVELLNPLSTEWSVFRTSLLISLLQNAAYNRNRQMPNLRFFEIGSAAWKRGEAIEEKKQIAALLVGETGLPTWHSRPRRFDFYDIKGIALALLEALGLKGAVMGSAAGSFWACESAGLYLQGKFLGCFGRLDDELVQSFKIKTPDVFGLQLEFDTLYTLRPQVHRFEAIPRFPLVPFDIALLLDSDTPVGDVEEAIRKTGGEHLVSVHLFDFYQGEQVPQGKKSVAFSLNFCSKERTLGVEEVERAVATILAQLAGQFGAVLRQR